MIFDWMKNAFNDIFDPEKNRKEKEKVFNEQLKENFNKAYETCCEHKLPMLSYIEYGTGIALAISNENKDIAVQAAYLLLKAKETAREKGPRDKEVKMLVMAVMEKTAQALSEITEIRKKSDDD